MRRADSNMPKLPVMTSKEIVDALTRHGFIFKRQKGSHAVYKHPDGRRVIVPIHSNKDIPVGTLHAILKDARVEV